MIYDNIIFQNTLTMTMGGGIDPIIINNEMLRASVLVCNIMILINDNPQGYDRSPVEDEEALHAGGLLGLLLDLLHHLHHHIILMIISVILRSNLM